MEPDTLTCTGPNDSRISGCVTGYTRNTGNDATSDQLPTNDECIEDIDCEGSWTACSSECETIEQRSFTETTGQSGSGSPCPSATNCSIGDGECCEGGEIFDQESSSCELLTCSQWWVDQKNILSESEDIDINEINPCDFNYSNSEFNLNNLDSKKEHTDLSDSCCECQKHKGYFPNNNNTACELREDDFGTLNDDDVYECNSTYRLDYDVTSANYNVNYNPNYDPDYDHSVINSYPGDIRCMPITGECHSNFDTSLNITCSQNTSEFLSCSEIPLGNCGGNCNKVTLRPENEEYKLEEINICKSSNVNSDTCCGERINTCVNSYDIHGNRIDDYNLCSSQDRETLTRDLDASRGDDLDEARTNCCEEISGECSGNSDINQDIIIFNPDDLGNDNMCDENYEVYGGCYLNTTALDCQEDVLEGGRNRCTFERGYCYPSDDVTKDKDNCCRGRAGYCIDNLSEEDYNECTGAYNLTENPSIRKTDISSDGRNLCCENRVGYCINNTDGVDFDCATLNKRNKESDILCSDTDTDGCSEEQCCENIDDKCIGNTDDDDNIICSTISGGVYINRTGVCVDQDSILSDILSVTDCTDAGGSWTGYSDIDGSVDGDKEDKCCRLIPEQNTCGGFIENNLCGDGRNDSWGRDFALSTEKHYESKTGVDDVNIEDNTSSEKIDSCCDIRNGYCKYNSLEFDFNCPNDKRYKQNPENIECTGDNCESQCCEIIDDMCINNTDRTTHPDIICNVLGDYIENQDGGFELEEDGCVGDSCGVMEDHPMKDTKIGRNKSDCCIEVSYRCGTGLPSTFPFNCETEIKDELGEILPFTNKIGSFTCIDQAGVHVSCRDINGSSSGRPLSQHDESGSAASICCDKVTGMCTGNTDISENFDCTTFNKINNDSEITCTGGICDESQCCETLSGYCSGNTDQPDVDCASHGKTIRLDSNNDPILKPSDPNDIIDVCCEATGRCFGNDETNDFDCETLNMENNTNTDGSPIMCGEINGCEAESSDTQSVGCCKTIRNQCINNTSSDDNITCGEDYHSLRPGANEYVCTGETCTESECCFINGRCEGNTLMDSNNQLVTPDVFCGGDSVNNGVAVVGRTPAVCCDTNFCIGNTDSTRNFTNQKCNTLLNPTGNLNNSTLVSEENRSGTGWDNPFGGTIDEMSKAHICCEMEDVIEFPPELFPINQFIDENVERFSNIEEGFINIDEKFINEDNIMLIETISNNQIENGCNTIKNDIIENLEIDESQLLFSCFLSKNKKNLVVNTSVAPLKGEVLSKKLIKKLKSGIPTNYKKKEKKTKIKEDKSFNKYIIYLVITLIILILVVLLKN